MLAMSKIDHSVARVVMSLHGKLCVECEGRREWWYETNTVLFDEAKVLRAYEAMTPLTGDCDAVHD